MLTEEQKAELIKRHATTYRNRVVETKALGFTEADLAALISDVEQAVRREMDADTMDAARWRFAVAPGLEQSMMWLDVYEDWDGSDDFGAAIDAAKGQT